MCQIKYGFSIDYKYFFKTPHSLILCHTPQYLIRQQYAENGSDRLDGSGQASVLT